MWGGLRCRYQHRAMRPGVDLDELYTGSTSVARLLELGNWILFWNFIPAWLPTEEKQQGPEVQMLQPEGLSALADFILFWSFTHCTRNSSSTTRSAFDTSINFTHCTSSKGAVLFPCGVQKVSKWGTVQNGSVNWDFPELNLKWLIFQKWTAHKTQGKIRSIFPLELWKLSAISPQLRQDSENCRCKFSAGE